MTIDNSATKFLVQDLDLSVSYTHLRAHET